MELILELLKVGFRGRTPSRVFRYLAMAARPKRRKTRPPTPRPSRPAPQGREIKLLQDTVNAPQVVADRVILYDRIKHLAKSYIKQGWISRGGIRRPQADAQGHHDDLGGNGFLDAIMEEVDKLEKRVL